MRDFNRKKNRITLKLSSLLPLVLVSMAVLIMTSLLPTAAVSATMLPLATTSTWIQRWSPTSMASDQTGMTQTQANSIANTFTVINAKSGVFTPYLAGMRATSPTLMILQNENAVFTQTSTQYPSDYYAHDATGALVTSHGPGPFLGGNYMMDMSNQNWLAAMARLCISDRMTTGYDGCYYGMLSESALAPGYVSSPPINPNTSQVWTLQDWVVALEGAVTAIRNANPGAFIAGNTLQGGGNYFKTDGTSVRPVLDREGAGQAEDFLRSGTSPITGYPSVSKWLNTVNMLVDAGKRGDIVLAQTKVWSTATAAQIDSWHQFADASFLLGTNGKSYMNFSTARTMAGLTERSPYDQVDVGTPLAAYSLSGSGAYERDFTLGKVFVNSSSTTVVAQLDGTYHDAFGVSYASSITLNAHSGASLIKG